MADLARAARTRSGRLATAGLAAVLEAVPDRVATFAVLTYHRVAPAAERPDLHPGLAVEPAEFERHVEWLVARACVASPEAVVAACAGGPPIAPGSVLLTFDDAYADFADHAWPVLRRHHIPALLFVPTSYPDTLATFWWDELHHALATTERDAIELSTGVVGLTGTAARRGAFAELRRQVASMPHDAGMDLVAEVVAAAGTPRPAPATLGWDAIRLMASQGLSVGAHSRTHPRLDRLAADRLEDEVAGSLADLIERVPGALPAFAYPGGGHDDRVVEVAARAGIAAAFTTERGLDGPIPVDPLRLHRINVGAGSTLPMLRAQRRTSAHALLRLASIRPAGRARNDQQHRPARRPLWS